MKWWLAPEPESEDGAWRPARLLLAEDDEAVRKLAALLLRQEGWQVTVAADGVEAVHAWNNAPDPFDLVILDLQMPNLGGYAAYQRIHKQHPTVRVLFMSGSISGDWDRVHQEMLPFLAKPFTGEQLVQAVRKLLPPSLLTH
ncbi:MAG: response regulator [Chloroflexi bacterium]|jgi:CheY-like chemotaxis protein|nr:response regulator [Chloroflexota bacterium]